MVDSKLDIGSASVLFKWSWFRPRLVLVYGASVCPHSLFYQRWALQGKGLLRLWNLHVNENQACHSWIHSSLEIPHRVRVVRSHIILLPVIMKPYNTSQHLQDEAEVFERVVKVRHCSYESCYVRRIDLSPAQPCVLHLSLMYGG